MKHKLLLAFAAAFMLAACNGDEIDELKKRLNRVENSLGNDPITYQYSTKDYDGIDVTKNASYFFKSTPAATHHIEDNEDGTYDVYVERFSDVDWEDYAWIYFTYNPETEEVSNPQVYVNFETSNWNNINGYVYECCYTENVVEITVKGFNAETGAINVSVHATTTANSNNNPFSGQGQTIDLSYKGKLELFANQPG